LEEDFTPSWQHASGMRECQLKNSECTEQQRLLAVHALFNPEAPKFFVIGKPFDEI
jgi:hypothetical protein